MTKKKKPKKQKVSLPKKLNFLKEFVMKIQSILFCLTQEIAKKKMYAMSNLRNDTVKDYHTLNKLHSSH